MLPNHQRLKKHVPVLLWNIMIYFYRYRVISNESKGALAGVWGWNILTSYSQHTAQALEPVSCRGTGLFPLWNCPQWEVMGRGRYIHPVWSCSIIVHCNKWQISMLIQYFWLMVIMESGGAVQCVQQTQDGSLQWSHVFMYKRHTVERDPEIN